MQGLRGITFIAAVTAIAIAAFFAGRSSVTIPEPVETAHKTASTPKQKLSALTTGKSKQKIASLEDIPQQEFETRRKEFDAGRNLHNFHTRAQKDLLVGDYFALVGLVLEWQKVDYDQAQAWVDQLDIPLEKKTLLKNWKARDQTLDFENSARLIASVYKSAKFAGADFNDDSPQQVARALRKGINGSGAFATTRFQTPYISDADLDSVVDHLSHVDGTLLLVKSTRN